LVARDEGREVAQTGSTEVADWDAGWDSDEKDKADVEVPPGMNRAYVEEERRASETYIPQTGAPESDDDDDAADAWGWGDDDATDEPAPDPDPVENKPPPTQVQRGPEMREMTLSEPYWTSSIPKPVFDIINVIYNDGAELTKAEYASHHVICALANLL